MMNIEKRLMVFHDIVEIICLAIIASAAFAVMTVDFTVLGGSRATMLTIAQIVVCFTCIPGGYMVKKIIDSLFEWVEEKILEETEGA